MALKARLGLTQSQTLSLTPAMRVSLQLLQLSAEDLETYVRRKEEENPLLERLDPPVSGGGGTAAALESGLADSPSLLRHLLEQATQSLDGGQELRIAAALIGELDEAGYLWCDIEEVAQRLGVVPAAVAGVLDRLQDCAPAGVFARGLAECLMLQLKSQGRFDEVFAAVLAHLDLLAAGGAGALAQAVGLSEALVAQRVGELRRLDPKPGLAFAAETTVALVPDLLVTVERGGRLVVSVNAATIPRIRLDGHTRAALAERVRRPDERSYLSRQAQEVAWLRRALKRRAATLQAVGQAIVERQGDYFFRGPAAIRPLTQRALAEALELSEATVSRVVANKHLASPRGTEPLKRFFSTALDDLGTISAAAAQARLSELVAREDPGRPLSDAHLAECLAASGLPVARRTVAKYRGLLRIPPAAARRRLHGAAAG